jgi:hypothetical protein
MELHRNSFAFGTMVGWSVGTETAEPDVGAGVRAGTVGLHFCRAILRTATQNKIHRDVLRDLIFFTEFVRRNQVGSLHCSGMATFGHCNINYELLAVTDVALASAVPPIPFNLRSVKRAAR